MALQNAAFGAQPGANATLTSQTNPSQTDPDEGAETSADNPYTEQQEKQRAAEEDKKVDDALKEIRLRYKQSWAIKRQMLIRRVLKAFEYLKSNPYSVMNGGTGEMDNISQVIAGNAQADDPKLYEFNDNIYQMLCLSFMAALGPDVSKTRWMPDDPQDEGDLAFAKKASTMEAYIERLNDMPTLTLLELLYLWVGGTYFCHTRNVVDATRAGTTFTPVMAMKDTEVFPDRYLCPNCGSPNPAKQYSPFQNPTCGDCQQPLGQKDFYPAESMPMPVQVDETEEPNSMTAEDVYCLLNVDVDPSAPELSKSPLLDLEGEMDFAAVRTAYPARYKEIDAGQFSDTTSGSTLDRTAREKVTSPTSQRSMSAEDRRGSFSRCWIQAYAFNSIADEELANKLTKMYPKGVKMVTYGDELVLEKVAESMLEHWTDCRTIKGLGMNPFGVGDACLNVQDRVDDTANNIHIYMDRMALPPVLANASLIDVNALGKNQWGGGRAIPVYPSLKTPGMRFNLQEAVWQPTFHADTQIYNYSQKLVMLMQLLSGVQPQVFGGGTQDDVDTASGQAQQLNSAMGRLMLFLTASRSEKARRAKLAVKCMASDIDDKKRITVDGAVDGQYENEYIMQSEVQGEVHAFPEADQGFPASYAEMRDRLLQILGMVQKNPVLENMLADPDTQELLALYLLPDGAKLPGGAERTKIKMLLQQLSNGQPNMMPSPQPGMPPLVMPSIQPDPDFDDMSLIVQITKDWAQTNYELATSKPMGYANVRAYLKLASTMQMKQQAAQAAVQAQGAAPGGGAPASAAPGGPPGQQQQAA
jgi:hypothetical protein